MITIAAARPGQIAAMPATISVTTKAAPFTTAKLSVVIGTLTRRFIHSMKAGYSS